MCKENTKLSWGSITFGEGNGNPLQCSCLENPRDGGAWWAAVYGVTQSWTGLKRRSSSSSSSSITFLKKAIYLNKNSTFHLYSMIFESNIRYLQIVYTILVKLEIWTIINNALSSIFLNYVCYFNKRCISHVVHREKHWPLWIYRTLVSFPVFSIWYLCLWYRLRL